MPDAMSETGVPFFDTCCSEYSAAFREFDDRLLAPLVGVQTLKQFQGKSVAAIAPVVLLVYRLRLNWRTKSDFIETVGGYAAGFM